MNIDLNDLWNEKGVEAEMFIEDLMETLKRRAESNRLARMGYGYYLDNCGDGKWYCDHCLQEDCGKRIS